MKIVRIVKEKQKEKEDLIEIRTVEEIVSRRFYKYLKMFKKKESKRILTRKTWDYIIGIREGFVLKKEKIYLLSKMKREEVEKFLRDQLKKEYI